MALARHSRSLFPNALDLATERRLVSGANWHERTLLENSGRVGTQRGALLPFSVCPPPNEVGYRRGTIRSSQGPFSLPSSQTGLDPFGVIRLSSPCFRNDAVDVPA